MAQKKVDFYYRLSIIWQNALNFIVQLFDELALSGTKYLGNLIAAFAQLLSNVGAWALNVNRSNLKGILVFILKLIVALPLAFGIAGVILICTMILGSLFAILGLRKNGEYSFKERVIVWLIPSILIIVLPQFIPNYYLFKIATIFVFSLGVIGLEILFGQCGIISLGHSGFLMLGGYLTVWIANGFLGFVVPIWPAILFSGLITAGVGFILGLPSLRVKDFYLFVITYVFSLAIPKVLKSKYLVGLSGMREGGLYLRELTVPFGLKLSADSFKYYVVMLPVIILMFLVFNLLRYSQIGRSFRAIRCDNEISLIFGVPVFFYKLLAFALSAFLAGITGGLLLILIQFISPDSYTPSTSIDFVVAHMIGGVGGIFGSMVGGCFLTYEPDITAFAAEHINGGKNLAHAFYGLSVILVILFVPKGLGGGISSLAKKIFQPRIRRGSVQYNPPPDYDFLEERKKFFNSK